MNINLKKVISSVAALAMSLSCFTAFAADFTDVEATASYKSAIDELVALEIVNGYEDGSFKPDNEITRAEVTKMVVAAMGDSYTAAAESSKGNSGFADVDAANHWASGFISVGVAQKFINGMGDGTFAPDANVTYAQIVKMLVAALGYDSDAAINGGYPNGYLQTGARIGVTEGVKGLGADTAVTRAIVAQLISNAIKTPLVIVTGWSQNYVTGEPIAETAVQDGTKEQDYKTLLTENHDAYVVRGRVTGTFGTNSSDVGKVDFDIEYADNWRNEAYDAKKPTLGTTSEEVYFGATNAEELLFTYAEAIIQVNEDDEATILAITPYGRNEIAEVATKDYAVASVLPTLEFAKSETSTKTDKYALDAAAKLYVNGAYITNAISSTEINAYIYGNEIGTVTLINSPDAASTSLDKDYDVVMVTQPKWAIVEETLVSGDENRIIFSDFEQGVGIDAVVKMDTTDEDVIYTFYKDGAEITFEEIAAGDVALLTFDPAKTTTSATNIRFDFSNTVVEGQVTGASDGEYTVNGAEYKLTAGLTPLEVSYEYSLILDAAGRVVKYDELATAKNYGIIDRVSYSTNDDAYVARIIKADGTRETVAVKKTGVIKGQDASEAFTLYNNVYAGAALTANTQINGATNALKAVANRIVTYKINSKGELNTVEFIGGVTATTQEYKENSMKIGSYRINDATAIIDATKIGVTNIDDATAYAVADLAQVSADMFVDGEQYTVILADKGADNCYKFALVLWGNASLNLNTGFAVVDSVASEVDEADGEVKKTITVLDANSQGDLITYFVDEELEDVVGTPARGTVVALGLQDGVVVAYSKLFEGFANAAAADDLTYAEAATIFSAAKAKNPANMSIDDAFFLATPVTAWDGTSYATANGWARAGFGMIINKNGSTVTVATGTAAGGVDANGTALTKATGIHEFDLDAEVNVYVVDNNYANKQGAGRISVGAAGSIIKTTSVKEIENAANEEIWNLTNVPNGEANYAYFKVVDGDITDIVVFAPAN